MCSLLVSKDIQWNPNDVKSHSNFWWIVTHSQTLLESEQPAFQINFRHDLMTPLIHRIAICTSFSSTRCYFCLLPLSPLLLESQACFYTLPPSFTQMELVGFEVFFLIWAGVFRNFAWVSSFLTQYFLDFWEHLSHRYHTLCITWALKKSESQM